MIPATPDQAVVGVFFKNVIRGTISVQWSKPLEGSLRFESTAQMK